MKSDYCEAQLSLLYRYVTRLNRKKNRPIMLCSDNEIIDSTHVLGSNCDLYIDGVLRVKNIETAKIRKFHGGLIAELGEDIYIISKTQCKIVYAVKNCKIVSLGKLHYRVDDSGYELIVRDKDSFDIRYIIEIRFDDFYVNKRSVKKQMKHFTEKGKMSWVDLAFTY